MDNTMHMGILVYPGLTQLDATGPAQVFSDLPNARVHLLWKTLDPIATDAGFSILPTTTFAQCPALTVLCAPGGAGQVALFNDEETMVFLREQAERARFVTSVCTGSLLLGAAGLLQGYRAACHWAWRDLLTNFGAEPVNARIVRDRNRITGGGVTAGIDFALSIAAELVGEENARMIQLGLEYAPAPPFACGSPEEAGPERVARFRAAMESNLQARAERIAQAKSAKRF